jgi:glycosyltransferase involved in cell wall biosynthesis
MNKRITVHVCTKDRHSEIALLLQSLRTQTYKEWDLILLDDASGIPLINCHFVMSILTRITIEGHRLKLLREDISNGVCYARNECIKHDTFKNPLTCRLDDDVIIEPDYFEKLVKGIEAGYDLVTGVIPLANSPEFQRETKFIGPIICEHKLDNTGNLISNKDELAFTYNEEKIIPCHQFRTNALYKSEMHTKFKYPLNLTPVGFREEGFFSFNAILYGYKLATNTNAIAYHLQTPSGGCRYPQYQQYVQCDHQTFLEWIKMKFELHGNFLEQVG